MNIGELFNSPEMRLPRDRNDEDYFRYLKNCFETYGASIDALSPVSGLCNRILGNRAQIKDLCNQILSAVQHYLDGTPSVAYDELEKGIRFVATNLNTLKSRPISDTTIGALYRIARVKSGPVPPSRLFHAPFQLRHKVAQHRYGIPGFPCLYLGDSLELCKSELRIASNRLRSVAVAQFGVRDGIDANVLDFGLRPAFLAQIALGRQIEDGKPRGKPNPDLEAFLADYVTCWPLMAASSIKVLHDGDPFVHEYIVSQIILQWLMQNSDVDGIRYFSTRFNPEPTSLKGTLNYVFPGVHNGGPYQGFSIKLKNMFELSDPILWGPWQHKTLRAETRGKERYLASLPRSPLP